ncbi:MAG: ABC transporter permease subunit [Anaerolineae bacterium]|nr:MAG: ABC transporter permease subunit [Anaerolineae bacterium]
MLKISYLTDFFRLLRYLTRRLLTVGLTIVAGVFLTVLAANHTQQIETSIEGRLNAQAQSIWRDQHPGLNISINQDELQVILDNLREEYGLNAGFLERHLTFTRHALLYDWGNVQFTSFSFAASRWILPSDASARGIILDALPATLLLVGASNLLIFVLGIPLALLLSRVHGSKLDRFFMVLAPISSIPSWVLGLLLVFVFAVELRLLPVSGMYGIITDLSPEARNAAVVRHMILPVAAIVLSQVFQLAFTWRSYLLVYANEDYVELAKAKGLTPQVIQRDYILRASYPFILTSFALTLVGFWQTTIALEIVFDWPGIGRLFIKSLPHFFNESMFPGEMVITVGLVVLFAYILGFTVLLLDFLYAIVDPRIRLNTGRAESRPTRGGFAWRFGRRQERHARPPLGVRLRQALTESLRSLGAVSRRIGQIGRELLRYPSAVVGAVVVLVLLAGSVYALVALPYKDIAISWNQTSVTGRIDRPRLAKPVWVSRIQGEDLLQSVVLDSRTSDPAVTKTVTTQDSGAAKVTLTYDFDFAYDLPPEEILVYFHTEFGEKRPFVFWTWTRPDGTVLELNQLSVINGDRIALYDYAFRGQRSIFKALEARPNLVDVAEEDLPRAWLFGGADGDALTPQPGRYTLTIQALFFEPDVDMDAELMLLGQTYGAAGTDLFRRDLIIPLFWGMPFALVFGLLGALSTVMVSMTAAATGVWFGGWVDEALQRLADANLILPVLAISVLVYAYFGLSLWVILGTIILLSAFGSPLKTFRSAFLQVIEEPYIEAARSYGASGFRIIFFYMLPRIFPVILPQLIALIPSFVFLEATLGMFNIKTTFPTWGKVIYEAINHGISFGSRFWVLQPLSLLLLTGVGFALLGYALDRVLNPRLVHD